MSLSPWDLTANLTFDFSLYRPRRPSYVIATQITRPRNESYRHATKLPNNQNDFIDGIVKKKRKASYKAATESDGGVEEFEEPRINGDTHNSLPNFSKLTSDPPSDCIATKNLIVLSLSFLLVFTAFRSIQNLQSSLNAVGRLGFISLSCLHLTMFLTSLFGPMLVDRLTSKWSIVLGFLSYLIWIAANFWPHFFTLVPSSICVGFGQSLVWSAQVTYMRSMIHNSKWKPPDNSFRFNGIFLASFQTSHVWGNLLSSFLLSASKSGFYSFLQHSQDDSAGSSLAFCGIYDSCEEHPTFNASSPVTLVPEPVLTLMGVFMGSASLGLLLSVLLLSRLKNPVDDSASHCGMQLMKNLKLMTIRKKFSYLIPLLIFNGFEQAFVCADYTKSYVSCSVGVAYVGYNMMTMGVTNFIFSFIIGSISKCVPREVLIGTACILHMALMVVLLVWIPDSTLMPVFFAISAFWGICNAIWQTQCNCLVSLCCEQEDQEVAFQNVRLLQGLGASLTFTLGMFVCASFKLYVMIGLLTTAVLFYVVLEYNVRRDDILPNIDHPSAIEVVDRK